MVYSILGFGVIVRGGLGGHGGRSPGWGEWAKVGEKIKLRGGATNNSADDKATPHMSLTDCAALGYPTPEYFVA